MPLLNYLGHASLFLAGLYAVYWLLFRKEAFHQLNRALLLLIMAGALILPLVPAPSLLHPAEKAAFDVTGWLINQPATSPKPEAYAQGSNRAAAHPALSGANSNSPVPFASLSQWMALLYFIGMAVLAGRLCLQMLSVLRLLRQGAWEKTEKGWLVSSDAFHAPFSFWNVIFLPEKYAASPLRRYILEHERVHQRQWHSADLLAAELFCLLFWFHPAAWRLNRALRTRLEYIADEAVLNAGINRKGYQYSLLRLSSGRAPFRLANQFNQSLIKTRIVMMNAKQSPAHYKLKYLTVLPVALLLVFAFNEGRAQAEESQPAKTSVRVGLGEKTSGTAVQSHSKGLVTSSAANSSTSEAGSSVRGGVATGLSSSSSVGTGSAAGAGLSHAPYESVFVAIGAEFPVERLPQMKKDLEEQGILLDIEELDYNADKLITRLKLNVRTTDGKMHGNGFSYNDGKPIDDPVIFYVRRGEGNYGFGIFTGKMNDKAPAEVRNVIERMKNGYFIGEIVTEE